ncbi:restriction endonuclease [Candidatus Poribacteria bacterium]|nr:MAG: restriction endonuclease [Candidatus Poribacteria bacterium]
MTREEVLRRFQNFQIWERRGERAPHKPLLILYAIGKLMLGEERLSYAAIEDDLRDLLKEFGPWRDRYRPQDPFWRLRDPRNPEDRVWKIPNAHQINEGWRSDGTSTGDALIGDLREHGVGGFLPLIADQLRNDVGLRFELVGRLLGSHFPVTYHADILQAVGIDWTFVASRQPRNPRFRPEVLEVYGDRCAICGFNVTFRDRPIAIEAAHIKWHSAEGPDIPQNGMALCALHHKLFDRGIFTLSDQLTIKVSEQVNSASLGFEEWLGRFDDRDIYFPSEPYLPDAVYVHWHTEQVFKGGS